MLLAVGVDVVAELPTATVVAMAVSDAARISVPRVSELAGAPVVVAVAASVVALGVAAPVIAGSDAGWNAAGGVCEDSAACVDVGMADAETAGSAPPEGVPLDSRLGSGAVAGEGGAETDSETKGLAVTVCDGVAVPASTTAATMSRMHAHAERAMP